MWKDEILEEIHKIREEHAKAFNYNLQAICEDMRRKQAESGRQIISKPHQTTPSAEATQKLGAVGLIAPI
ncbi:MAG: hypothetical protein GDA56_11835 [Hormoscilla sp. GM7CHS1pb]|nr:hypothetical protein [Hormoscilla sp. GM7CHS1pb]